MIDLDALTWDRDGRQRARAERCLRWLGPRRPAAGRLRSLLAAMRAAGLGPASVNRHWSALRRVYPGLAVPWQREPRGRSRVVSRAELAALVAALPPAYGSLVTWLSETGMRVGEALALKAEDAGPAGATVRTSKNGEPRVVPLTATAAAAWAASPSAPGWSTVSRSSFQHAFRQAATAAGCPGLRPHDLRHACATRLTTAGVPLPTVAAWLGHRDLRSTLRYSHPGAEALRRAKDLVESSGVASDGLHPPPSPTTAYAS